MIRSGAPRAQQLLNAEVRCIAHQRRFKTFVRRVDKKDEVYYTLANPTERKGAPEVQDQEFFDMPNLLLDLDAEGGRGIRVFDENDEQHLRKAWDVNARRSEIKPRVKEIEEQVYESRRKAQEILSNPTNVWRITSHDILSAALLGAPGSAQKSRSPEEEPPLSDVSSNGTHILESIRSANGIPEHAVTEDTRFLEWMLLRQRSLEKSNQIKSSKVDIRATSHQLYQALREQTSVTGIRRLVFQYLSAGSYSADDATNLAVATREACIRVLDSQAERALAIPEVLVLLRNLNQRLAGLNRENGSSHLDAGAPLQELGSNLAAETGDVATMKAWELVQ